MLGPKLTFGQFPCSSAAFPDRTFVLAAKIGAGNAANADIVGVPCAADAEPPWPKMRVHSHCCEDPKVGKFAMPRANVLAIESPCSVPDISRVRRIGFLVYDDIEALDICGPLSAFGYADCYLREAGRTNEPSYEIPVIAASPGLVRTQSGLQIAATHGFSQTGPPLDTLIVVGGLGAETAASDPDLIAWLRATAPHVRRLASVCTGAFLLAAAGLLNDRRVTTHWMFCDRLAELHPSLSIARDLIFVRDGHVYTSGGITSGIDLALALIEEDVGRDIAMSVARIMVVFLRRPGGQTQFSPFLYAQTNARRDIRELQGWILANPEERLDVASLAERVSMSPRNFARSFRAETRMTPGKFVELARVAAARCSLEQSDLAAETFPGRAASAPKSGCTAPSCATCRSDRSITASGFDPTLPHLSRCHGDPGIRHMRSVM